MSRLSQYIKLREELYINLECKNEDQVNLILDEMDSLWECACHAERAEIKRQADKS